MRKSKMYRIENILNDITHKMYVTKFWFSSKWKLHIFLTPGTQFSCFWKIVHFSTLFAKTLQNESLNMLTNRFLSHGINNFSFWSYFGREKYKNWIFVVRFYIEILKNALKSRFCIFDPFFMFSSQFRTRKIILKSQIITLWKWQKLACMRQNC